MARHIPPLLTHPPRAAHVPDRHRVTKLGADRRSRAPPSILRILSPHFTSRNSVELSLCLLGVASEDKGLYPLHA